MTNGQIASQTQGNMYIDIYIKLFLKRCFPLPQDTIFPVALSFSNGKDYLPFIPRGLDLILTVFRLKTFNVLCT